MYTENFDSMAEVVKPDSRADGYLHASLVLFDLILPVRYGVQCSALSSRHCRLRVLLARGRMTGRQARDATFGNCYSISNSSLDDDLPCQL
jgi:hypothetical protein